MLTKEQILARRKFIGGTDAAPILGLSRWRTPLQVWAEKTGQVEPEDLSDRLAIEVGNELEDLVCKLFEKRTGLKAHRVNEALIHPNYGFIGAHIDRRIVGKNEILEAKTASGWKAREWAGEDCPQEYVLQALHYLGVTGAERCHIAVLIGGNQDFRIKTVERDSKLISEIIQKEAAFWTRFVEPGIMPSIIKWQDSDTLYKLFPHGQEEKTIELGDDANRLLESLEGLKADKRALEQAIEKEENEIKAMLKDNAIGMTDRYRVRWMDQITRRLDSKKLKEQDPSAYDKFCKDSKTRVFRFAQIKQGEKQND